MLKPFNIFDTKKVILVSFLQLIYGISELFFSFITGLALAQFVSGKNANIFSLNLSNINIILLLILSIICRYLFGFIATKYSAFIVFSQWKLLIEKFFFVIRNGRINLNQVSKLTSMIQNDSRIAFQIFYINSFSLLGDALLLLLFLVFLSVINFKATIYSLIVCSLLGFTYLKSFSLLVMDTGYQQKESYNALMDKFRSFLSFRDMSWIRSSEKIFLKEIIKKAERTVRYTTNKIIFESINKTTLETFGIILLVTFPVVTKLLTKNSSSPEELVLTFVIWIKVLVTFNKSNAKYQNIIFNFPYARDLFFYIENTESLRDYFKRGFLELDSFTGIEEKNNSTNKILEVDSFAINSIKGYKYIFPKIQILKGKRYLLQGPSGSGKSTLIKQVLYLPSSNHKIPNLNFKLFSDKVSYISSEHELSFGEVKDFLNEDLFYKKKKLINNLLLELNLNEVLKNYDEFYYAKLDKLSSGQKMRVRFLCELLYNPEFIIIDEAFSSLDRKTLIKCVNAVKPTTSLLVIDHSNDLDTLIQEFIQIKIKKSIIN